MLEPFLQSAAGRVLARTDGERRMTDYLHVAERLQEAEHEVFGREGLVRWLDTAIERGSEGEVAEADRIRLEDDSDLVQVTTVHRAKGLQWPVVFVPYAPWLGTGGFKKPDDLPLVFHDDDSRTVIDLGSSDTAANGPRAVREHKAEQIRSLYVAFTRAEEALFFVHGAAKNALDGPLAWVLHHGDGLATDQWHGGKNPPDWFDAGRTHERLMQLRKASDNAVAVEVLPEVDAPRQLSRPAEGEWEPARSDLPAPPEPWSVFSYSRLAGRMRDGGEEVAGRSDETDAPSVPDSSTPNRDANAPSVIDWPRGAGFGQSFHNILEAIDFSAWPAPGQDLGEEARKPVTEALRLRGIPTEPVGGRAPVKDTAALVAHTLHAPLPDIGPLAAIPAERRRCELEFFLRLGGSPDEALLEH
ncbi:MAG: 3'-5' exonuclease, partial [Halofilum sp. (in: g-proteobacteria)]